MPALSAYTVGVKRKQKLQYTVRDVPIELDRRLRDSARHLNQSLNQTVVELLARAAGTAETTTYKDLDSFFGSWTADVKVDQALAEQRKIDKKLWR
jgi:hypothetical protein